MTSLIKWRYTVERVIAWGIIYTKRRSQRVNATFNNISAISWRPVLLEDPPPPQVTVNFITYCCIGYTSPWWWFGLTTLMIIGSCKSNYHTITQYIWRTLPMNTVIRQYRHYFLLSLPVLMIRSPYWLDLLVVMIIFQN